MEYVKSYDFAYYTTRINHFLQRKDRQNIKVLQDFSVVLFYIIGIILFCYANKKIKKVLNIFYPLYLSKAVIIKVLLFPLYSLLKPII